VRVDSHRCESTVTGVSRQSQVRVDSHRCESTVTGESGLTSLWVDRGHRCESTLCESTHRGEVEVWVDSQGSEPTHICDMTYSHDTTLLQWISLVGCMSHVTHKNDSCFGQSNGHLAVELQTDPWQLGCIGMRETWLIQNVSGNPIHMSPAKELSRTFESDITHLTVGLHWDAGDMTHSKCLRQPNSYVTRRGAVDITPWTWHHSFMCVTWLIQGVCRQLLCVWHMNESCHTHGWVTSRHFTYTNQSCYSYEWVKSPPWMSHVTHMNESRHSNKQIWSCT